MSEAPTTFRVGMRSLPLCLLAGALGGLAWGAIGWGVVLARPVPGLPLWAVWTIFLAFGVAFPVHCWTASGTLTIDATASSVRIERGHGAPIRVQPTDIENVVASPRGIRIEQKDGTKTTLLCSQPDEVANALEQVRNPG